MGEEYWEIVQRNAVKMKSKLTIKWILALVTIIVVIAAITLFVRVPMAAMVLGLFSTALLTLFFSVLALLPISTVLLLTFIGFGAITIWAIYKRDLKPVLFPGSLLVLPPLIAAILIIFSPTLEWHLTYYLLLPLSAIMLSIFVGLGAIVISPSCRQDLKQVFKLIGVTFGALVLSMLFQLVLFFLWALALRFVPFGTNLVTVFVIAYLYWPGKKRGLFLKVFGAVLALELALLLTVGLIS